MLDEMNRVCSWSASQYIRTRGRYIGKTLSDLP